MSYDIAATLIDSREKAIKALCEHFLNAGGMNTLEEQLEYGENPGAVAEEMRQEWGFYLPRVSGGGESFTVKEAIKAFREILDDLKIELKERE